MAYSVTLTKEQFEAVMDSLTHYNSFLMRLIVLCDSKETDLNPADVFEAELHNVSAASAILRQVEDGQPVEANPLR